MMHAAMRELAGRLHAEAIAAAEAALNRWQKALDLVDETSLQVESEVQASPEWDRAALARARRQVHDADYVAVLDVADLAACKVKAALQACHAAGRARVADLSTREAQLAKELQNEIGAAAEARKAVGEAEAHAARRRQAAELALQNAREHARAHLYDLHESNVVRVGDAFAVWMLLTVPAMWAVSTTAPRGDYLPHTLIGTFAVALLAVRIRGWLRRWRLARLRHRADDAEQSAAAEYDRETARIQAGLDSELHSLQMELTHAETRVRQTESMLTVVHAQQHRLVSLLRTIDRAK